MPSYRNIDQPQYFYVAEIRHDLNPKCPFPSPELYDTFQRYYNSKYGLEITNLDQPLLDVDHTSARLNLLTPRYMNQKGVALPTSSAETRRARRENLQQKQILIPELCDIHPFPASLWRKAVCLPAIMYRMNYLLIAEELRVVIADEAHIGIIDVGKDFRFPDLEFGFSTKPGAGSDSDVENTDKDEHDISINGVEDDSKSNDEHDISITREGDDFRPNDADQVKTLGKGNQNGQVGLENDKEDETSKESSESRLQGNHDNSQRESVLVGKLCEISNHSESTNQPTDIEHRIETALNDTKNFLLKEDKSESKFDTNELITTKTTSIVDITKSLSNMDMDNVLPLTNGAVEHDIGEHLPNLHNCSMDKLNHDSNDTVSKADLKKAAPVILGSGDEVKSRKFTNANLIPAISLGVQGDNISTSSMVNGHAEDDEYVLDLKTETIVGNDDDDDDPHSSSDESKADNTNKREMSNEPIEKEETEDVDLEPSVRFDQETNLKTFIGPSPCTILQTLTMSNANDFFNLERLETIGDSFLKFAITVYLYCTYPGIHEGKLSYLRSKQVSNYNLYKLGKKKAFPDCMVAAKFEPTENWLPPGYVIKKDGAFKGLSVRIASKMKNSSPEDSSRESSIEKELEDGASSTENEFIEMKTTELAEDMQKRFNQELLEATNMEEERTNPQELMKSLIPYNLQTQHSLPDKSIADCVEALIGCYLTTCGQRAALQFMSWLGLKVLPDGDEDNSSSIHHGNNLRDILQGNSIKIGFPNGSRNKTVGFGKLQPPPSPLLFHVPNASDILEYYLDGYEAFEKRIKYQFNDRSYLLQAFTHASYHYNTVTDCYQRYRQLVM